MADSLETTSIFYSDSNNTVHKNPALHLFRLRGCWEALRTGHCLSDSEFGLFSLTTVHQPLRKDASLDFLVLLCQDKRTYQFLRMKQTFALYGAFAAWHYIPLAIVDAHIFFYKERKAIRCRGGSS